MESPDFDLDEGNWIKGDRSTGKLSWRGDPIATFSDWVIVVRAEEDVGGLLMQEPGTPTTFHVHKNILAIGERASAYFNTQFNLTCATIETKTSTTTLVVPALCLPCMPLFLDFVYEGKAEWNEEVVVPLMELARRLEVPGLGRLAMAWLKTKLSSPKLDCLVQCLEHATELNMAKVQAAGLKVIAPRFDELNVDSASSLPLNILIELLQSDDLAVASEDKVFDVIVHHVNKTHAEVTQQRQLWECLRFAFLTFPKQLEALTHESFPQDLFFNDAVASVGIHQCGSQAIAELRTKVPARCACRLVPRTSWGTPHSMSVSGFYPAANSQNTLEALFDGCFETGVCTNSPGWITISFVSLQRITKVQASGYHGCPSSWGPTNGARAGIEFSVDGVSYARHGEVPGTFGKNQALADIPLLNAPILAKHMRFTHTSHLGLSQIRIE